MLFPALQRPINLGAMQHKLVYSPHLYGPGTIGRKYAWDFECDMWCLMCYCRARPEGLSCEYDSSTNRFAATMMATTSHAEALANLSGDCAALVQTEPSEGFPDIMMAQWDYLFGDVLSTHNATAVVGEWGGTYIDSLRRSDDDGITREQEAAWEEKLVEYLVDRGIGSFYWCLNPESDDTGGLLEDDWVTLSTSRVALLRRLQGTSISQSILSPHFSTFDEVIDSNPIYQFSGDAAYSYESTTWNRAFDGAHTPIAVMFPRTAEEVVTVVLSAKESNLKVCVRSGGHSYEADSSCDGLLVDLRHLKRIQADGPSGAYWVGAGNTNGEIQTKLIENGRMVPSGNHGGVGLGFSLGCGRSYVSRAFGLGCDFIRAATVITADGALMNVTDDSPGTLLWALKGAGSAGFVIVTELLMDTFPLPTENFTTFSLRWPRRMSTRALEHWQLWAIDHPNSNLTVDLMLWNEQVDEVCYEGVWWGSPQELEILLVPVFDALGPPSSTEIKAHCYAGLLSHLYGIKDKLAIRNPFAGPSGSRRAFKNKSHLARRRLNSSGIETLLGLADETIAGAGPFSNFVELTPLRGLIQTKEMTNSSVFGHRDALAVVQYGERPYETVPISALLTTASLLAHRRLLGRGLGQTGHG